MISAAACDSILSAMPQVTQPGTERGNCTAECRKSKRDTCASRLAEVKQRFQFRPYGCTLALTLTLRQARLVANLSSTKNEDCTVIGPFRSRVLISFVAVAFLFLAPALRCLRRKLSSIPIPVRMMRWP